MYGMAQKVAAALMAATLVLGGLVGCSLLPPRSAQDVLMRYARIDDRGNFVAEGNVDVVFSVFKTEVPLSIDITAQVMGEALHTVMSTKVFGTTMSSQSYMQKSGEDYVVYSSAGEDNDVTWTKSTLDGKKKDAKDEQGNTSDAEGEAANPIATVLLAQKVLEASEFEASDDGFVVTVPGSALLDAINSSEQVKKLVADTDPEVLKDVLTDATIVLSFDKSCYLTHLKLNASIDSLSNSKTSDAGDQTENLFNVDASCKVAADFAISGYGSVESSAVTVPADVEERAVDLDALSDDVSNLFNFENLGALESQEAA